MGRNKIEFTKIDDSKFRLKTYFARRKGLLKKAMELSLLCGSQILLIITSDEDYKNPLLYSSHGLNDLIMMNFFTNTQKMDFKHRYSIDDVLILLNISAY